MTLRRYDIIRAIPKLNCVSFLEKILDLILIRPLPDLVVVVAVPRLRVSYNDLWYGII